MVTPDDGTRSTLTEVTATPATEPATPATGPATDDVLSEVVQLEVALLDPAVRADRSRLDELLHADFVEFGASGRVFDRNAILDELVGEGHGAPRVEVTNVAASKRRNSQTTSSSSHIDHTAPTRPLR